MFDSYFEIFIFIILSILLVLIIKYLNLTRLNKSGSWEMELGFINPKGYDLTYDIIEGRKTVEGRKLTPKLENLKPHDILILKEKDVNITCEVTRVTKYDNVLQYAKHEPTAIPGSKSLEETTTVYREAFKVPTNVAFLGIGIKPIKVEWLTGVKQPHFDNIKRGEKTAEGRLNVRKFKHMAVGHLITFMHDNDMVTKEIKQVVHYPDFRTMLESEVKFLLPGTSVEDGLDIYHKYYKPEDAKKYGVLSLRF